jgi:acyl-CoA synthetase (AMP-forming)/AMP-acid ligase II
MIKTAGANVSPAEVEQAIAKVASGAVAHVFGIPDSDRGQVVAAVVLLDNGNELDEARLRRELATELSAYKIPRRFVAISVAEVPLLASGKADVQQLKRLFDA